MNFITNISNISNITNITIDPEQIFTSNIDLKYIDHEIINSSNKYINNFLKHNPHLGKKILYKQFVISSEEIIDILDKTNNKLSYDNGLFISILCSDNKDEVVNYILKNNLISFPSILSNSNPKVENIILSYLEENKYNINDYKRYHVSSNTNNKIIEYIIKNPDYIHISKFFKNENDLAVDYVIENFDKQATTSFCLNKNPKAINYCYNKN